MSGLAHKDKLRLIHLKMSLKKLIIISFWTWVIQLPECGLYSAKMAPIILCSLLKDFSCKCAHFLEQKIQNVHPGSCERILTATDTMGRLYRHSCVLDNNTYRVQAASIPRRRSWTKRLLVAFLWILQTHRWVPDDIDPGSCQCSCCVNVRSGNPEDLLPDRNPEESGKPLFGSTGWVNTISEILFWAGLYHEIPQTEPAQK